MSPGVRAARAAHPGTKVAAVRAALEAVRPADYDRASDYATRDAAQAERFHLPALATTTIGSFPQTAEIRRARAALGKGEITEAQYAKAMKAEIASVIALQEELGLDVLVHGEAHVADRACGGLKVLSQFPGHCRKIPFLLHGGIDISMLADLIDLVPGHVRSFMALGAGMGLSCHLNGKPVSCMAGRAGAQGIVRIDTAHAVVRPP